MCKLKIYNNPEEAFEQFIKDHKEIFIGRLKQLPDEELPHVETRIRKLYFETYSLCVLGFHNSTIIMCGVLCEALLKDLIYDKEKKEAHEIPEIGERYATFGRVINFCFKKKYINSEEKGWFLRIKEEIRDIYQHGNVKKIVTKKIGGPPICRAQRIKIPENSTGEELFKILKDVVKNPQINELISGEEMRPIYDITKGMIDEQISLPLFLEVDKFLRSFAIKYFDKVK